MSEIPGNILEVKKFPYHKRYHQDMIADAIDVDLRVYGALTILRDLMFVRGGSVPDDKGIICRLLRYDPRYWPNLLAT
jgi:hypothetical protein